MILEHLPEVRVEILKILNWYFKQEKSLAAKFHNELKKAERDILEFPDLWHPLSGGYRRHIMKRFPYSLVYRVESDRILVVAVAGHKQSENYLAKKAEILTERSLHFPCATPPTNLTAFARRGFSGS